MVSLFGAKSAIELAFLDQRLNWKSCCGEEAGRGQESGRENKAEAVAVGVGLESSVSA